MARVPRLAWFFLGVALLGRVSHVLLTGDAPLGPDPGDYHRHAVSIAFAGGFPESGIVSAGGPSAFRPPLFPFAAAAVYKVVGVHVIAVRLLNAVVGAVGVGLLGLLGTQLLGRRTGLVSMGIASVYPPLVLTGDAFLSEAAFVTLELGAICAVVAARADRRLRWCVFAGLLVGLAALDRPNGLILLIPLSLAVWRPPRRSLRALRAPAVMVVVTVVTVAPWAVRNSVTFDRPVLLGTAPGFGLSGTYNETSRTDPQYSGAWRPPEIVPELEAVLSSGLDEEQADRELRRRSLELAADHPEYVVKAGLLNTLRMFDLGDLAGGEGVARDIGVGPRAARAGIFSFWLVAALALVSVVTRAARRVPLFLWGAMGMLFASAVFISGTSRYRMPLEPMFVLLAAQSIVAHGWRLRRTG